MIRKSQNAGRPSKRAIEVAGKVLASDPCSPARMIDAMRDKMWTLQWSELRILALSVKRAADASKQAGRSR